MADVDKGEYTNPFTDSETRTWDIVNNYDWTSAPAGSKLRSQTPNAYVTAYKMEFSQLQQFIDGYINIAASAKRAEELGTNPGLQFYKDMYKSGKILADINFPFFSDDIRSFSSEYADTFSPISQRGASFMFGDSIEGLGKSAEKLIGGTIAGAREFSNVGGNAMSEKVAAGAAAFNNMAGGAYEKLTGLKMPGLQTVGAPGSYIETPKFYQYSNTDEGVVVEFVLSNTLHDYREGPRGFKENIRFIKEFTMMNRPYREGPIEMTFPAIYHIEIPGLRYIEWAALENFGIQLIGARRRIGKDIIPEAYGCKFAFRSLTMEAANFVQMTNRVEGFDEKDAGYIKLRKAADKDAVKRADLAREAAAARQKVMAAESNAQEERERKAREAAEFVGPPEPTDRRVNDPSPILSSPQDRPIDPRSGRPVGEVVIHGSGYGTAYHREKYPEQYGETKENYYDLEQAFGTDPDSPSSLSRSILNQHQQIPADQIGSQMSEEDRSNLTNWLRDQTPQTPVEGAQPDILDNQPRPLSTAERASPGQPFRVPPLPLTNPNSSDIASSGLLPDITQPIEEKES